MKNTILIFMIATAGHFSCRQGSKSKADTVNQETLQSTANVQGQKRLTDRYDKSFDSQYAYTDSTGRSLTIQNSFPKSGIHYTDPAGKQYIYAVFWTRIVNETGVPCELTIDFPAEPAALPSAPGIYYRLFLPPDPMTIDKLPLYDYGLTGLPSFLDKALSKPSSLNRTIRPNESTAFYVVTLSNKGVDGTLRTGFSLKDGHIFYRINQTEIPCGKINLKKLILRK